MGIAVGARVGFREGVVESCSMISSQSLHGGSDTNVVAG
mgnify:FL=1